MYVCMLILIFLNHPSTNSEGSRYPTWATPTRSSRPYAMYTRRGRMPDLRACLEPLCSFTSVSP